MVGEYSFELFVAVMFFMHFIGDYVLKSEYLSLEKGKSGYCMFVHCVLYTGSLMIGLMSWANVGIITMLLIFASHYCIDTWKCRALAASKSGKDKVYLWGDRRIGLRKKGDEKLYLFVDQLVHFVVIAALIYFHRGG